MNKISERLVPSTLITLTFAIFQATQCMEEKLQENSFSKFQALPIEVKIPVLKHIASDSLSDGTVTKLPAVCKEWQSLIKQHKTEIFKFAVRQVYPIDPETYGRFLNGRLVYKPNKDNDIGKIELRITDLTNPLEGTFDLSKCGDAGKYLSISTGYRKGKKPENAKKVEIWFVPRFLVEKEINGAASHFKEIFPNKWPTSAPVGIIWTGGWGWDEMDWYDYLTSKDFEHISNGNLYEISEGAGRTGEDLHSIDRLWDFSGESCDACQNFVLKI